MLLRSILFFQKHRVIVLHYNTDTSKNVLLTSYLFLQNVLFIILELGTGFTSNYKSFLACRALFGIAMGGLYGNAAATALEDCPEAARGIVSGMLQQGYAFGYLLATAFARGLVNTTRHGWRPVCVQF